MMPPTGTTVEVVREVVTPFPRDTTVRRAAS